MKILRFKKNQNFKNYFSIFKIQNKFKFYKNIFPKVLKHLGTVKS